MPAPSNIERWLSQVGSLTHTPLSGNQRLRKSAPTFRPPLEPTDWIVATRPVATAGDGPCASRCARGVVPASVSSPCDGIAHPLTPNGGPNASRIAAHPLW